MKTFLVNFVIMPLVFCIMVPMCDAQVVITPESVEASPGGIGVDIGICLDNSDSVVASVQLDLCEYTLEGEPIDGMECMDCKLTERTTVFNCEVIELPNGCCRMLLFCQNPDCFIDEGLCDISTIVFRMFDFSDYIGTPCIVQRPVNMVVVDNVGSELLSDGVEGEVCYPDTDVDGMPDRWDNCPDIPNGPELGTCLEEWPFEALICTSDDECSEGSFSCSMDQEDSYPPGGNNCGDACECEGDFDGDGDVKDGDIAVFKASMGRGPLYRPCSICTTGSGSPPNNFCQTDADCGVGGVCDPNSTDPCYGDFDCDGDVKDGDIPVFKADMGRYPGYRPCPPYSGVSCSYD